MMNSKTSRLSPFTHQILTANGYQSVAAIVAEMQADGTDQRLIDRWLQGLQAGRAARANYAGRTISGLSVVAETLMVRHEAKIQTA